MNPTLHQGIILRLRHIRTHHQQMYTLLHLRGMVCTLHLRGLTPHLTSLPRGTKATSTTSNALTTRRRRNLHRRMGDMTTTTSRERRIAPLGSSKDVWPLSAAAACWRNAAASSEILDSTSLSAWHSIPSYWC